SASPQARASRIVQREGGSFEQKFTETLERDRQDSARYLRIYGIDTNDLSAADLIIQTENHSPSEITDIIISYLEKH
ncbi:MAG: cytidylate kinase, partial [Spirochaetales bacterium]|nr:cytidylate kinase [Spirochaetales bacterium]